MSDHFSFNQNPRLSRNFYKFLKVDRTEIIEV